MARWKLLHGQHQQSGVNEHGEACDVNYKEGDEFDSDDDLSLLNGKAGMSPKFVQVDAKDKGMDEERLTEEEIKRLEQQFPDVPPIKPSHVTTPPAHSTFPPRKRPKGH